MNVSRMQLSLRQLMIATAVVALVLAALPLLVDLFSDDGPFHAINQAALSWDVEAEPLVAVDVSEGAINVLPSVDGKVSAELRAERLDEMRGFAGRAIEGSTMRLPSVRFTIGSMTLAVAVVAICLQGARWAQWPAGPVQAAARESVPGIIIQSVCPEKVNERPAWEVRGTDPGGTEWLLDISETGEVLMREAVAYGPPRSVVVPDGF